MNPFPTVLSHLLRSVISRIWHEKWIVFVLLFVLIISKSSVFAFSDYYFKHYNINNGLSQNTVFCIMQDRQGFMWFGTKDGLNRFDGNAFKTFRFSPGSELRDNVFHRIVQDKKDNMWVGTDDGVYIYNVKEEKFNRFNVKTADNDSIVGAVSDMLTDSDGDIWISVRDKGVFLYRYDMNILENYSFTPSQNELKGICLCEGKNQTVWVFPYSQPFFQISKNDKKTHPFLLNQDDAVFYDTGEIGVVIADQQDNLLIGTSRQGLISVSIKDRTYRKLLQKDQNGNPIFIRNLLRKNDNLWIASESGIYVYNLFSGKIVNLRHNNGIPHTLSDNAIYSIYEDYEGGIWLGSYFGGVDYYPNRYNHFEMYYPIKNTHNVTGNRVREFCNAPNGNIWIGTEDNGLNLFNPFTNEFLPLPEKLTTLYPNIHALCDDGKYLWVSTFSKGLNRYDLSTKELITYSHTDSFEGANLNNTFALCQGEDNTLWIGTLSGLYIYDYQKDSFASVEAMKGIAIQDILKDSKGYIWISTFLKGLYRFNPKTDHWEIYHHDANNPQSLPYDKVTSVFEDNQKRIWITTQGGGFCAFDKKNKIFSTYNSANGLPNDVVYQIVQDNNENLWLSTNSGLVEFNPEKRVLKNYTVDNGLKTNQFNYKSSYKTEDGTIYFGSVDGFIRFNPANFVEPRYVPPIVFTDFYINNYSVAPNTENSPLNKSILHTDALSLAHNKNSFSIRYAVLNYSEVNAGKVFYKLDGFDKEWIEAKGEQTIIYSNLNPGKYTLTVKLNSIANNNQTKASRSIHIRIRPPFWLSTWAYMLYLLLLVVIVLWFIRFSKMREQRRQQRKMRIFKQNKERELYQSKIEFFTNVAHEIRTPLSLIKGPLEYVLSTEKVSKNVKDNLQIMSKNTDRLLYLTNQLLDFRKTESDAYLLNLEMRNISELIRETFLRFTPLAKQNALDFQLSLPDDDIYTLVDKEAFLKIISNLLNNAIKYCNHEVRFTAHKSKDQENTFALHIVVENDGEIIHSDYREEIFKPFVHIDKDKDKSVQGTGIGLALSRSLAELHKGTLFLENHDKYNRFHLVLPIENQEESVLSVREKETTDFSVVDFEEVHKKQANHAYSILLVDDDADLVQFEAKCLSPYYDIHVAENGEQAMKILEESKINLVVSDVMMPKMDGFQLTKRIKSNIEFSHIPVILLTAKVTVQSKVEGFETGADAYIEKPFSVEVLMAQISNLLKNREKLRNTFLEHPFIGATSIASNKSDEEFIKKLHTIVHQNIENPDFKVETIAAEFNMSRASFYRKISGILDLTPNEYIRIERLKKSAQLLKEKQYKINEICYMTGFNSPSYFTKCFQQQFGVSPKDFA